MLESLAQDSNVYVLEEQINFFRDSNDNYLLAADLNNSVVGTVQLNICPDAMYKQQPYTLLFTGCVAVPEVDHSQNINVVCL